jgi:hypothetical protein
MVPRIEAADCRSAHLPNLAPFGVAVQRGAAGDAWASEYAHKMRRIRHTLAAASCRVRNDAREPVPPDTAQRLIFAQSRAQAQDHRYRLASNPFVNIDRKKAALIVIGFERWAFAFAPPRLDHHGRIDMWNIRSAQSDEGAWTL